MTTEKQRGKIFRACVDLLKQSKPKIREVASCIGLMVSSFLAVPLGPLYYRSLEQDKIRVLRERKGDWGKPMMFSDKARGKITWWVENVQGQVAPIQRL